MAFRARKVTGNLAAASTASDPILVQDGQGVVLSVLDDAGWTAGSVRVQARAKGGTIWANLGLELEKDSDGTQRQIWDMRPDADVEVRLRTSSDFAGDVDFEMISQSSRFGD